MKQAKAVLDRKVKSKEIYFLSCGYEECAKNKLCGPIVTDYYILHFILSGKGYYYANGKHFNVEKNQCFLI